MVRRKNGPADFRSWEKEMMDKHGWYVHFIIDEVRTPCNTNYHTHGLMQTFNHPDMQICLPIDRRVAQAIFNNIVDEIAKGNKFLPDLTYLGLVNGEYAIRFATAQEGGRRILRVLIPDEKGTLKSHPYNLQISQLSDGSPLNALYTTPSDIKDLDDVIDFMISLYNDHQLNFHPDTPFEDYVSSNTDNPVFTPQQALQLNAVMDKCFDVCGKTDIYGVGLEVMAALKKVQESAKTMKRPSKGRRRR